MEQGDADVIPACFLNPQEACKKGIRSHLPSVSILLEENDDHFDIIERHLVFVPSSWHRPPKSFGIS